MAVVLVQEAGALPGQQITRAGASTKVKSSAHWAFFVIGFALVAAGWALGYRITTEVNPLPFTPIEGISVFAVMYVFAQALERLMEPIVGLYPGKDKAVQERDKAVAQAKLDPAKATDLANKEENVNRERANLAVLAWGLTSFLAMLGSGYLGMYLLHAIGLNATPAWLDIPITGLAIGGGTKPLHDLVKNIEKAKEGQEDKQKVRKV